MSNNAQVLVFEMKLIGLVFQKGEAGMEAKKVEAKKEKKVMESQKEGKVMFESEKKEMEELRKAAEELAETYNSVLLADGKAKELQKISDDLAQTVNKYTSIAKNICFAELKGYEDPLMEAVKRLVYQTIAVKDEKTKGTTTVTKKVVDVEKNIDVLQLYESCGRNIGRDPKWPHIIQKINFLLTAQKAKDVGFDVGEINDSYAISDIAAAIDMGKTPTSKTNMLKTLQTAITAMIGEEYKCTSHDVNFLLSLYSTHGKKAQSVRCARHNGLTATIVEICSRIVRDGRYTVEYVAK